MLTWVSLSKGVNCNIYSTPEVIYEGFGKGFAYGEGEGYFTSYDGLTPPQLAQKYSKLDSTNYLIEKIAPEQLLYISPMANATLLGGFQHLVEGSGKGGYLPTSS